MGRRHLIQYSITDRFVDRVRVIKSTEGVGGYRKFNGMKPGADGIGKTGSDRQNFVGKAHFGG
jgi:hypothetical protein